MLSSTNLLRGFFSCFLNFISRYHIKKAHSLHSTHLWFMLFYRVIITHNEIFAQPYSGSIQEFYQQLTICRGSPNITPNWMRLRMSKKRLLPAGKLHDRPSRGTTVQPQVGQLSTDAIMLHKVPGRHQICTHTEILLPTPFGSTYLIFIKFTHKKVMCLKKCHIMEIFVKLQK